MLQVQLVGTRDGRPAEVTPSGELVSAPASYDETVFNELGTDNTPANYYQPLPGKQFVVTGIIAYADKQVGTTTGATVVVYEAANSTTATVSKTLFQIEIPQTGQVTLLPLKVLVNKGVWVNGKTDDDDVHMTIMGYYISEL